jgi:hypothetical protein
MAMQSKPTETKDIIAEKIKVSTRTKVYIIIVAWVLAAVKTIIPFPYVSKPCMLGYKSGCSFAPISTIILIVGAVVTYYVAKKKSLL